MLSIFFSILILFILAFWLKVPACECNYQIQNTNTKKENRYWNLEKWVNLGVKSHSKQKEVQHCFAPRVVQEIELAHHELPLEL